MDTNALTIEGPTPAYPAVSFARRGDGAYIVNGGYALLTTDDVLEFADGSPSIQTDGSLDEAAAWVRANAMAADAEAYLGG